MTRKIVTAGLSLSVAATGLLLTGPAGATAPGALASTTSTHFALGASGYSTRITGGQLPAGSDQTAFAVLGCTNKAGLDKTNHEAELDLSPAVDVKGATTRVWTTAAHGAVSSWAENDIAKATLGDPVNGPSLTIRGITSLSRAYHNAKGFHATTVTSIVGIRMDLDGSNGAMAPIDQAVPTPNSPLTIPGLATVSIGTSTREHTRNGALAKADAVRVKLLPLGAVVTLAHSRANIAAATGGIFSGSSYGSKIQAADGHVTSKMTPFTVMPCLGTDGVIFRKDVARINPSNLVIRGLTASEQSDQAQGTAYAWERGRVARLNLGHGKLVVKGVVGKARVNYSVTKGITKNIKGSNVLAVFSNGKNQGAFPDNGVIEIPGVAKLEQNVVHRTQRSISVIALRITLLDKTGAVINLGRAKVGFTKSAF